MRKALLLVVASAMVAGGLGLLFSELFWATRIYFLSVFGGAALVAVGGYLLWEDFLAPALGRQEIVGERTCPKNIAAPTSHERVQAVERMQRDWQAQRQRWPPCAGSTPRYGQGVVLAEDRRRARFKASLADDRLRQLRHRGRSGPAR